MLSTKHLRDFALRQRADDSHPLGHSLPKRILFRVSLKTPEPQLGGQGLEVINLPIA